MHVAGRGKLQRTQKQIKLRNSAFDEAGIGALRGRWNGGNLGSKCPYPAPVCVFCNRLRSTRLHADAAELKGEDAVTTKTLGGGPPGRRERNVGAIECPQVEHVERREGT
eukprot:GFKZ01006255.1.p2 GENE.GFKZ01006255.1~~GFKZ01006255.1.p2  ORF type:complete len:110 (+),score=5.60 GFKZ01006255.1:264-593(+)